MRFTLGLFAALAMLLSIGPASAAMVYEFTTQTGIVYAEHDGTKLAADLYHPKGLAKAPVLVAIHGGGFQFGSRAAYTYWGAFLARNEPAKLALLRCTHRPINCILALWLSISVVFSNPNG